MGYYLWAQPQQQNGKLLDTDIKCTEVTGKIFWTSLVQKLIKEERQRVLMLDSTFINISQIIL